MKEILHPHMLHDYQRLCVSHQLQHCDSMLWLGMGLGKTPITLTTIVDRMRAGQVRINELVLCLLTLTYTLSTTRP